MAGLDQVKPGYDEKSSARNREQGETTAIRAGRELTLFVGCAGGFVAVLAGYSSLP
jgi:hypothetical protein